MMTEFSRFFKLPEEIKYKILENLKPIETAQARFVSKQFNRLLEDELLWKRYLTEAGIENAKKNGISFSEWFGNHLDDLTTEGLENHPLGSRYQQLKSDLESKNSTQKESYIRDVHFRGDSVNVQTICCSTILINMILKDVIYKPSLLLTSLLGEQKKHVVLLGLKTILEDANIRAVFVNDLWGMERLNSIVIPFSEAILLLYQNAWFINQLYTKPDRISTLRDIISQHTEDHQLTLFILEKLLPQKMFFEELLIYRGLSTLEDMASDLELHSDLNFDTIHYNYETDSYPEEAIKDLLNEFTRLFQEKIAKEEIEEATPIVNSLSQRN